MNFLRSSLTTILITLSLVSPVAMAEEPNEPSKEDRALAQEISGVYRYLSGQSYGQAIPPEKLVGDRMLIDGFRITLYQRDEPFYVIKYTIKNNQSPYRLSMRVVEATDEAVIGSEARGLLERRGETLAFIYDFEGGYPDGFETATRTQNRFVLEESVVSRLDGVYRIVEGVSRGRRLSDIEIEGRVVISPQLMSVLDANKNESYAVEYRVIGVKEPYRLRMTAVRSSDPTAEQEMPSTAPGLLKFNGDEITIVYDFEADPDRFPTDFETELEPQNKFVLRRIGDRR